MSNISMTGGRSQHPSLHESLCLEACEGTWGSVALGEVCFGCAVAHVAGAAGAEIRHIWTACPCNQQPTGLQ